MAHNAAIEMQSPTLNLKEGQSQIVRSWSDEQREDGTYQAKPAARAYHDTDRTDGSSLRVRQEPKREVHALTIASDCFRLPSCWPLP